MPRKPKAPLPRPRGGVAGKHASPGQIHAFPAGPGRFRAVFTWKQPGERRGKRYSASAPTETEALAAAAELRTALAAAPPAPSSDLTLSQYLAAWLTDVVEAELSPRTYEIYLVRCRRISRALGAVPLTGLTRSQVQAFFTQLRRDGELAPATIRGTYAALSGALKRAVQTGLIPSSPATLISMEPIPHADVPTIAPEQLAAILAYAEQQGDRLTALWTLIATTGLRRGEALGLSWADVDLERRMLRVRQQLTQIAGELRLSQPKTRAGRRTVDRMDVTAAALAGHRLRMGKERLAATPVWPASDLVFLDQHGGPLRPRSVDTRWRRLLAAGEFPHIHLHALRHTVATLMIEAGESARTVADQLGHSNINVTLGIYTRATETMRSRAIQRLEGVIWGEKPPVDPADQRDRPFHA